MNTLHQLPDGNWIDPASIYAIIAAEKEATCAAIPDRVIIRYGRMRGIFGQREPSSDCQLIGFDTYEAACAYRDELAGLVNEAKADAVEVKIDAGIELEKLGESIRNLAATNPGFRRSLRALKYIH